MHYLLLSLYIIIRHIYSYNQATFCSVRRIWCVSVAVRLALSSRFFFFFFLTWCYNPKDISLSIICLHVSQVYFCCRLWCHFQELLLKLSSVCCPHRMQNETSNLWTDGVIMGARMSLWHGALCDVDRYTTVTDTHVVTDTPLYQLRIVQHVSESFRPAFCASSL